MDLFVAPTIGFDLLYGLVIIRLARRDLVWINVTPNPTAEWIARQITEAFPWDEAPHYLIRDKPITPASPWQNAFAERLIGSIRRECVDHIVVLGEAHLRRNLQAYARYYNDMRTHRSLDKDAPRSRPVQWTGSIMHMCSSAASTTITSGFRFSVHTPTTTPRSRQERRPTSSSSRTETLAVLRAEVTAGRFHV